MSQRGVHVFCGMLLVVNCILRIIFAFMFHSAPTGGTRNMVRDYKTYLPQADNRHQLGAWIKYYLFIKKDHPLSAKLGVPQKLSYLAVCVLILVMGYTGFCLWIPTASWSFFAAGTAAVGGMMSMRIIHYFMMFVFICFSMIHIYLVFIEGTANAKNMLAGKEHGRSGLRPRASLHRWRRPQRRRSLIACALAQRTLCANRTVQPTERNTVIRKDSIRRVLSFFQ